VRLDPKTTVANLLTAIPSSFLVFNKLGIATSGNEAKALGDVCSEFGIHVEEFLKEMDGIDWNEEVPPRELSRNS
jgi:hypothetical protein